LQLLPAAVLGVVQGITEFLPISSDGHLALVYRLFGMRPNLTYEVFLHGATLIAMYAYFWRDIVDLLASMLPKNAERKAQRRTILLIIVGTLVSGIVAKLIEPVVEPMSASMIWVSVWFLGTSLLLFAAEYLSKRVTDVRTEDLPYPKVAFVGLMQGLAVLPGLSRSGSTIASGMMAGLSRERAARFSFLLGIPIITLAFGLDAVDVLSGGATLPGLVPSSIGFIAAAVSGYFAIRGLLKFVRSHRLYPFAIYTAALAAILFVMTVLSKG